MIKTDSTSLGEYKNKYFGSNGIGKVYKDEIVTFVKELLHMNTMTIDLDIIQPNGNYYYEKDHGPLFRIGVKWNFDDEDNDDLRDKLHFVKKTFDEYGLWDGFIIRNNKNNEHEILVRSGLHEETFKDSRIGYYEEPSDLPTKLLLLL